MEILSMLEEIRNPVLNAVCTLFTALGSEIILIVVLCFLYWCYNKKFAYRLGFVYSLSGVCVQVLKIVFQVPRPWLRDTSLTPVESAVNGATGYSFPSGHTQNATAMYGTIAYFTKKKWAQILMLLLIFCVGFSRMYLGVHTPADVAAGFIITIIFVAVINYVMDKKIIYRFKQITVFFVLMLIPVLMVAYGLKLVYSGSVDIDNAADYFKAAGAAAGVIIGWYLETTGLNFDERKGSMAVQIAKYVVGLIIVLAIKEGLKIIIGTSLAADFARYGIIVFWVIYLYPLIFSHILKRVSN